MHLSSYFELCCLYPVLATNHHLPEGRSKEIFKPLGNNYYKDSSQLSFLAINIMARIFITLNDFLVNLHYYILILNKTSPDHFTICFLINK